MANGRNKQIFLIGALLLLALSASLTSCGKREMTIKRDTVACQQADHIERLYLVSTGGAPGLTVDLTTQTFVDVGVCSRVSSGQTVQPKETVGNARKVALPGQAGDAWVLAEYLN